MKFKMIIGITCISIMTAACSSGEGGSIEDQLKAEVEGAMEDHNRDASATTNVLTIDAIIKEAEEIGEEAFEAKYPMHSYLTLKGRVMQTQKSSKKLIAFFGLDTKDKRVVADFKFEKNGGDLDATKKVVGLGDTIVFEAKLSFITMEGNTLKKWQLKDCVAK